VRSAGRRARLVEWRALARWEQRCERELQRWEPAIRELQERAIAWNDPQLMDTIREGLRGFETIAQRSTGAGPIEWARSRAAIDWRTLRLQARSLALRDEIAQRAAQPDEWGDINVEWDATP
jgi:hypothetical protein